MGRNYYIPHESRRSIGRPERREADLLDECSRGALWVYSRRIMVPAEIREVAVPAGYWSLIPAPLRASTECRLMASGWDILPMDSTLHARALGIRPANVFEQAMRRLLRSAEESFVQALEIVSIGKTTFLPIHQYSIDARLVSIRQARRSGRPRMEQGDSQGYAPGPDEASGGYSMNRSIAVTESDFKKLQTLVDAYRLNGRDQAHLTELEEELNAARIMRSGEIPEKVVTMNSRVRVTDLDTEVEATYQIVFPRDADISKGRISVLAPVGTALLGYSVGDEIEWTVPGGVRRFRIDAVEYQPEARKIAV